MTMNRFLCGALTVCGLLLSPLAHAHKAGNVYLQVTGGVAALSDKSFNRVDDNTTPYDASFDAGLASFAALGYYVTRHWAIEFTGGITGNDIKSVTPRDDDAKVENFASVPLMVNGIYHFAPVSKQFLLRPYGGFGVGVIQELDIDIDDTVELQRKNRFAYQFIGGVAYSVHSNIDLTMDIRYMRVEKTTLKQQGGNQRITEINYDPVTINFGVSYHFKL